MPEEITTPPSGTPPAPAPAATPPVPSPAPVTPAPPARTPEGDATRPVVPEKYDLKAPEGYAFNEAALAKYQEQARARGLTQEQAQADIDYLVGEVQGMEQRRADTWRQQQETWLSSIKADKELGGDHFAQTASRCDKTMAVLDPSGELRKVITAMGIGNHPVLVKAFAKLGQFFEDDPGDPGGDIGASGDSLEAKALRMFPNSLKKR